MAGSGQLDRRCVASNWRRKETEKVPFSRLFSHTKNWHAAMTLYLCFKNQNSLGLTMKNHEASVFRTNTVESTNKDIT